MAQAPVNFRRPVVARAAAILLPAGAWDAAPTEMQISNAGSMTMYLAYTRGAVGGAVDYRIEVTAEDPAVLWCRSTVRAVGALVAGVEVVSNIQGEITTYTAEGAGQEGRVIGPMRISDGVRWIRIGARESGNVANPGNLAIACMFGN